MHLLGFIIGNYHDARSPERQKQEKFQPLRIPVHTEYIWFRQPTVLTEVRTRLLSYRVCNLNWSSWSCCTYNTTAGATSPQYAQSVCCHGRQKQTVQSQTTRILLDSIHDIHLQNTH